MSKIAPNEIRAVRFTYSADPDPAFACITVEHSPAPQPDVQRDGAVALLLWWDTLVRVVIDAPDDATVLADACEAAGCHHWAAKLREFAPILAHYLPIVRGESGHEQ